MPPQRRLTTRPASGITLTSMLVGLTLGLAAMAMAFNLLLLARTAYATVAEQTLIEEKGQQALDILTSQLRHAGWASPARVESAVAALVVLGNCEQVTPGDVPACRSTGTYGSDALQIRFAGSGLPAEPALPDDTIIDCAGYGVPDSRTPPGSGPAGLSLFYIGRATDGEPQLLCRYPARQGNRMVEGQWTSRSLIRGVELMRVRLGIDDDGDGTPDRTLDPAAMPAAPGGWRHVVAVHLALVVRAERNGSAPAGAPIVLFRNPDATFTPSEHPQRLRQLFATTIQLRNPSPCESTPC